MQVVTSTVKMQQMAGQWRGMSAPVVLVPTMGALHEGHLSLIRRARKIAGKDGRMVVSIYVNPTQFGPREDLASYPRDFARDKRLCAECGTDVVFAPGDKQMYPEGFSTYVVEESLSRLMEGQSRPTHFRGVTTVVAKLFHLVQPDTAVFGAKDFQQAAVIKRMVRDLNLPVKIVVAPIRRERDGLAMSSRNQYLTREERTQAIALWEALQEARRLVKERGSIPSRAMRDRLRRQIERRPAARVDYVELFDPETLQPAARAEKGVQIALAVFIARTRLIDNARL
jgi:pantoate--beta-alanine ligase